MELLKTKKCQDCGTNNPDNARYCLGCGLSLLKNMTPLQKIIHPIPIRVWSSKELEETTPLQYSTLKDDLVLDNCAGCKYKTAYDKCEIHHIDLTEYIHRKGLSCIVHDEKNGINISGPASIKTITCPNFRPRGLFCIQCSLYVVPDRHVDGKYFYKGRSEYLKKQTINTCPICKTLLETQEETKRYGSRWSSDWSDLFLKILFVGITITLLSAFILMIINESS